MTPKQMKLVSAEIKKRFKAKVQVEAVNTTGRYRFEVVSKQFEDVSHMKRQKLLWQVVDELLPHKAILDISLILAYAPSDLTLA